MLQILLTLARYAARLQQFNDALSRACLTDDKMATSTIAAKIRVDSI
jgi:hypothetical protein